MPTPVPYPDAVWAEALRHARLVRRVVRPFAAVSGFDADDLLSEGLIGVCEAIRRYDPAKGLFVNYAAAWIKVQARAAIRSGQLVRRPHRVPLADLFAHRADPGRVADAVTAPAADPGDLIDLRDALAALSPARRETLARVYGLDGRTPGAKPEVAASLGVTRQAVQVAERRALDQLRARLDPGRAAPPGEAPGRPASPTPTGSPRPTPRGAGPDLGVRRHGIDE